MDMSANTGFEADLTNLLPSLRAWARALTRNAASADDLVQDVAIKALAGRNSFIPGTNFRAWMHRIMINQFITGVRSRREYVSVDDMPEVPVPAEQFGKIDLEQLTGEFSRLPPHLREALHHVAIEQHSYEETAAACGCAIGTLKSRVHRARATLRARMEGKQEVAA